MGLQPASSPNVALSPRKAAHTTTALSPSAQKKQSPAGGVKLRRQPDLMQVSRSGQECQPGVGAAARRYRTLPSCPPWPRYRSVLRPKYKVGYKTVTDLAWRCCPGLTGERCPEHLTDHGAAPPRLEPAPQIPSGQLGPGLRPPPYSRAAPSPHGESAHGHLLR